MPPLSKYRLIVIPSHDKLPEGKFSLSLSLFAKFANSFSPNFPSFPPFLPFIAPTNLIRSHQFLHIYKKMKEESYRKFQQFILLKNPCFFLFFFTLMYVIVKFFLFLFLIFRINLDGAIFFQRLKNFIYIRLQTFFRSSGVRKADRIKGAKRRWRLVD